MSWSVYGQNGQRKYLTRGETEAFLNAARLETASIFAFCWMIAESGCRISEALSLTAGNIDFESQHVIIQSLKKRRSGIYRAVPLSAMLIDALAEWINDGTLNSQGPLWTWCRMTGYRYISSVMDKAEVHGPWASPKGLRHGFGVRAVHAGVPLNLVQRWLGHADMKTTAIYASAIGPEEREIAARTWLDQTAVSVRQTKRRRTRPAGKGQQIKAQRSPIQGHASPTPSCHSV